MVQHKDPQQGSETDARLIQLSPLDNVLVLRGVIEGGEQILISGTLVVITQRTSLGHKLAARKILSGDKVTKYGAPIGSATQDIALGDHVHIHNMKSNYTSSVVLDAAASGMTRQQT